MPNATQKDLQDLTKNLTKSLTELLKTEIGGLRSEFKTDLKSEIGGLRSEFKTQFKFQRQELESYLDDKFETNRRLLVDDMQNFQDAIIKSLFSTFSGTKKPLKFPEATYT